MPLLSKEATIVLFRELSAIRPVRSNSLARKHPQLAKSVIFYFGSLRAARKAARVPEPPPEQKWTKRKILLALRKFFREQPRITHSTLAAAGRQDLRGAIELHFGSIVRARKLARIPEPPNISGLKNRKWTKELLLAEIIARHESGEPINSNAVPTALHGAACYAFGTWRAAVEAAGFDYDQVSLWKKRWSRRSVLRELRARAARNDHGIAGIALYGACRRYFGSLAAARRAAGIPNPRQIGPRASREEVMRVLRERAQAAELSVPTNLAHAVQLYFGSARAARRAAGVDAIVRSWTKAQIISYFGRHPNAPAKGALADVCRRHFGSLIQARVAAGYVRRRMIGWTKSRILDELRRRVRTGRDLGGLRVACEFHFGSVERARELAGVPKGPWTRWSRERVIQELRIAHRKRMPISYALTAACVRCFGAVSKARAAARLPTRRKWTRELVIAELREAHRSGKPWPLALPQAARVHFGSLPAARRAAKLPARPARRNRKDRRR